MYVCAIEDELEFLSVLTDLFREQSIAFKGFNTVEQFRNHFDKVDMDILLLDRRLPGQDGLSFLQELRQTLPCLPIVILSGQGAPEERVEGALSGATDYITKPCYFPELNIKLQNLISDPSRQHDFFRQGWQISDQMQGLKKGNHSIRFSALEYKIFQPLARNFTELVSYEDLENHIGETNRNTISAHIKSIRQKLKPSPFKIQAARNLGYRLFTLTL